MANTNSNYNALNQKVVNLIAQYGELKKQNRDLEDQLSGYENQRVKTKADIETIISKIDELESE